MQAPIHVNPEHRIGARDLKLATLVTENTDLMALVATLEDKVEALEERLSIILADLDDDEDTPLSPV